MAWECAECNDHERNAVAVCHHCGKPLCSKDLLVVLDDAFAAIPRKARRGGRREAVHCRKCRRDYHWLSFSLEKEDP